MPFFHRNCVRRPYSGTLLNAVRTAQDSGSAPLRVPARTRFSGSDAAAEFPKSINPNPNWSQPSNRNEHPTRGRLSHSHTLFLSVAKGKNLLGMSIPCTNAPAKCEGEQPSEYPAWVHEANAKPTPSHFRRLANIGSDNGTVVEATPEKRTGRKSMSRRSGQNGCIQEDGNWYVVRFWKDVEGQEKRQRVRERICPISGPGKLSASERKHKAKEIIAASGADTAEHFERVVRSNHGITFREQAEIWLKQMKNRKRKPVAPSTLENWERCLRNWLNPNIGDMPLDSIGNLALRNLGADDGEGRLRRFGDKVLHKRGQDGCGFGGQ